MALGDGDTGLFLSDFGKPVVWGSYTTTGILSSPDELMADRMAISSSLKLRYATATLPGLPEQAEITVGGAAYTVSNVRLVGDGTFSDAYLIQ